MKARVYFILLALVLSACGYRAETDDTFTVVATVFAAYSFALELTRGTNAQVTLLLPPGADSHSYEPTPADMLRIQNADLFVYGGGDSELWVKRVLESLERDESRNLERIAAMTTATATF
jgi:zinc transport system substrate-binding protein